MTAPQGQDAPAPTGPAGTTQTHTWISVGLTSFAAGLAAFSPKVASYASAHPTGAAVVFGLANVLNAFLPSAAPQSK